MYKVKCPSCGKKSFNLDLSEEYSICSMCSFSQKTARFLGDLTNIFTMVVQNMSGGYSFFRTKDSINMPVMKIEFDEGLRIINCIDLDSVLPFVQKLNKIEPGLTLSVVGGVSKNMDKCPLCMSDLGWTKKGVECSCKKFTIDLKTFVFSRIATRLGLDGVLGKDLEYEETIMELCKLKPNSLWRNFWGLPEISVKFAKLQLRQASSIRDESFVLAVELLDTIGTESAKERFLSNLRISFYIDNVNVMRVEKVL